MRDKNAERFMRSVDPIDAKIKELSIKHETLALPAAIRYDKDRVQTSPSNEQMDSIAQRLIDIEGQINNLYNERADRIDLIFHTLDRLSDDRQRMILIRHYIRHERVEKIAESMSYDVSWTYKLLRTGLRDLSELIK